MILNETFFEYFEYEDFNSVEIKADVLLLEKNHIVEFNFTFKDHVNVNCDVTNEPYNQDIERSFDLVVNFGDEFNDENDDLIITSRKL